MPGTHPTRAGHAALRAVSIAGPRGSDRRQRRSWARRQNRLSVDASVRSRPGCGRSVRRTGVAVRLRRWPPSADFRGIRIVCRLAWTTAQSSGNERQEYDRGDHITNSVTLDVFGRRVLAVRLDSGCSLFYVGSDGKRRPAQDIFVPSAVTESELAEYLADLCHEWASPRHPGVTRVE